MLTLTDVSIMQNPLDVARLPQPPRSANGSGGGNVARRTRQSPRGAAGQRGSPAVVAPVVADKRRSQTSARKPWPGNHGGVQAASNTAADIPPTPKPQTPGRSISSPSTGGVAGQRCCQTAASPAVAEKQGPQTSAPKPSLQRSVSSPPYTSACRPAPRSKVSLDKQLKDRLRDLRLKRDEVQDNKAVVNQMTKAVLEELRKRNNSRHCRSLYDWDTMNSGSYYDQTKVR